MKTNPKMVKLMGRYTKFAHTNMLSYHESLTLFNDQKSDDKIVSPRVEMYKTTLQGSSAVSIFERDKDNDDLRKVYDKIFLEFSSTSTNSNT